MDERRLILSALTALVEPVGRTLPPSSEVVLHDLALLPGSIVAIHGDVTGRKVGDPATDLLLEGVTSGRLETMVNYVTRLDDGRRLRSTTMIVRDGAGEPVAALCINADVSVWQSVQQIAGLMLGEGRVDGADLEGGAQERFARDVDELAAHLVRQAIAEQNVPVELMKKEHKLAVVRSLQAKGMFSLRDAVEMIASSLEVTRFTIYNYLNEINGSDEAAASSEPRSRGKGSTR